MPHNTTPLRKCHTIHNNTILNNTIHNNRHLSKTAHVAVAAISALQSPFIVLEKTHHVCICSVNTDCDPGVQNKWVEMLSPQYVQCNALFAVLTTLVFGVQLSVAVAVSTPASSVLGVIQ